MQTIQVVLDSELLSAADCAAKQQQMNRSALIREALRNHLQQLHTLELEERDRQGYARHPDALDDELGAWEGVAAWPEA
jgi:metal-responsive CopG/Arc/MetJ family transcriptional regulator